MTLASVSSRLVSSPLEILERGGAGERLGAYASASDDLGRTQEYNFNYNFKVDAKRIDTPSALARRALPARARGTLL